MSTQFILGVLLNTLSFGEMAFTNEKTGISGLVPKFIDYIFIALYVVSFFIILFSTEGWLLKIVTCLLLQFLINHIIWGAITGIITGIIIKKRNQEILKELKRNSQKKE